MNKIKATKLNPLNGRAVYRFPVELKLNRNEYRHYGYGENLSTKSIRFTITAHNSKDAANHAKELIVKEFLSEITLAGLIPVQINVTGVRGGLLERFIGFESAIFLLMFAKETPKFHQLNLELN